MKSTHVINLLGFSRAASSQLWGVKLFWIIIIIGSWSILIVFCYYTSYQVFGEKRMFQSTYEKKENKLFLPDVTICAANPFQGYLSKETRRAKCENETYRLFITIMKNPNFACTVVEVEMLTIS